MKEKINIIQFMPYFPPHKWWVETVWEEIGKYWVKNNFWEFINIVTYFDQPSPQLSHLRGEGVEQVIYEDKIIWYKKDWYEVLVCPSIEIINNFPVYKVWDRKYKLIKKYLINKTSPQPSPLEERGLVQNWRVVTHTRFFLTSLIWWIFAKTNKIKWIHVEHWSDYVKLSSKLKSYLSIIYDKIFWKWIFKKANRVLVISEACKSFINRKFVRREVEVFYRWIELKKINLEKKWEVKIVFVWRLVKLKWVEDLINAYKKSWLNNELIIIWDWEEKQNLEKISKWFNIKFLWFKNKNFIEKFLADNNCILINPSYQEWLPTTVIEWLFYKNVVIASNVWWTNEISNKEDLILFEAWNIDELSKKIKFALKNYENLYWKSKKVIEEKFSWDKNIKKYYLEFKKLVDGE